MSLCHAEELGHGAINWRCSQTAGHYPETPHAYDIKGVVYHEWTDES